MQKRWQGNKPKQIQNNKPISKLGVLFQKAVQSHQKGDMDQALELYKEVLKLDEKHFDTYANMGLLFRRTNRPEEAIDCYTRALTIKPEASIFTALGNVEQQCGRIGKAKVAWHQALQLDNKNVEALLQNGRILFEEDDYVAAETYFIKARDAAPNLAATHLWLGRCWRRMPEKMQAGIDALRRSVDLAPEDPYVQGFLSEALLSSGNLQEGFARYEWRLKRLEVQSYYQQFASKQQWQGEIFAGKKLLIYWEQGLGDTLQFVRYIAQVKERGGFVGLFVQSQMLRLLQNVSGADIVSDQFKLSEFDLVVPLVSLPYIFGTTLNTIPKHSPYVEVADNIKTLWQQKRGDGKLHVGLVWAGNSYDGTIKQRSCDVGDLASLADIPNVVYYSLQKGEGEKQLGDAPAGLKLIDWASGIHDFLDTAGAVKALDLIISVDTAVPHLAGALNCPVWTVLPYYSEWRWLTERDDTPWYSSMRLFRQEKLGDWSGVFAKIATLLRQRVEK